MNGPLFKIKGGGGAVGGGSSWHDWSPHPKSDSKPRKTESLWRRVLRTLADC